MATKDSLIYWFPKLTTLSTYLPKTRIVPYNHFDFVAAIEGEHGANFENELPVLLDNCWQACQEVTLPSFVRTDLASAKHDGPQSYFVKKREDLERIISRTVEDNEMKFGLFGPTPTALVFRQFLKLNSTFTAFHGLPIAREFRFFVEKDVVRCIHFYWPEETIRNPSIQDWKKELRLLNDIDIKDLNILKNIATQAVQLIGDSETGKAWSVDFAQDVDDKWWLIDMADANRSFHVETCPNSKRKF